MPEIAANQRKPGGNAALMEPPAESAKPLPVTVKSPPMKLANEGPKTLWWCGTVADSPVRNISIGPVTFMRHKGNVSYDDKGEPDHPESFLWGDEVELTEEEVKIVREHAVLQVMRVLADGPNGRRHGRIFSRVGNAWSPSPQDRPLAEFVYMVPGRRRVVGMANAPELPAPMEQAD